MVVELENSLRLRALGLLLLLAGSAITVQFFRTLREEPLIYVLAYILPAALFAVGGILAFGGTVDRLVG